MITQAYNNVSNPITGAFGYGQVTTFTTSGTFYVPTGITSVRVRLWGGGGGNGGGGGGFALKVVDVTGVSSVGVAVASMPSSTTEGGGTSSFGTYMYATGGAAGVSSGSVNYPAGGTGMYGDINSSGGTGINNSGSSVYVGGGVGGLFGTGGNAAGGSTGAFPQVGNAGAGGSASSNGSPGVFGLPGSSANQGATTGFLSASIDFFGTGPGGYAGAPGINGGGGGNGNNVVGGFPGGGGGGLGSAGLVIIEY